MPIIHTTSGVFQDFITNICQIYIYKDIFTILLLYLNVSYFQYITKYYCGFSILFTVGFIDLSAHLLITDYKM